MPTSVIIYVLSKFVYAVFVHACEEDGGGPNVQSFCFLTEAYSPSGNIVFNSFVSTSLPPFAPLCDWWFSGTKK